MPTEHRGRARTKQNMLKKAYFLRNLQTSRSNKPRILRIKNAKFSGYCFYLNTNIQGDFETWISVPLRSLEQSQTWNFIKKETLAQVFSCEFCEISKNTFFYRTPLVAASDCRCMISRNAFHFIFMDYVEEYVL